MSHSGNVDNAVLESFFSSLKTERVGVQSKRTGPETGRELMYSTTSSASTNPTQALDDRISSPMEFESWWDSLSGCHPNRVLARCVA